MWCHRVERKNRNSKCHFDDAPLIHCLQSGGWRLVGWALTRALEQASLARSRGVQRQGALKLGEARRVNLGALCWRGRSGGRPRRKAGKGRPKVSRPEEDVSGGSKVGRAVARYWHCIGTAPLRCCRCPHRAFIQHWCCTCAKIMALTARSSMEGGGPPDQHGHAKHCHTVRIETKTCSYFVLCSAMSCHVKPHQAE